MVFIRSTDRLPCYEKFQRGSIATLLIVVMVCLLVILPFGLNAVNRLYDWLLVRRAHQYVQQILPMACTCISPIDLADGQVKMQTVSARTTLTAFFHNNCPAVLQGRLSLQQIRFTTRRLTADPEHWMGDRQPLSQPVVTLDAVLLLSDGQSIPISHAIEIFLD